jgi:N-acetylmuramoyl-L-alanine amidase
MLQTLKTKKSAIKRFIALPLIASTVLLFSFVIVAEARLEKTSKKIILLLDAGHGGKDAGSRFGTLTEKELCLKVATRIRELSADYNVAALLTRNADETLSLAERVKISDQVHPDDFISIHLNDESLNDAVKGDFGIYISEKNPQSKKSRELGSAIGRRMAMEGGTLQRSLVENKGIYVLSNNTAPSLTLVLGDIKNEKLILRLKNKEQLDKLCRAILQGVVDAHKQ